MLTHGIVNWFNRTWNVTCLVGKEPELDREEEWHQLDMVELTSMHSTGTKLLKMG